MKKRVKRIISAALMVAMLAGIVGCGDIEKEKDVDVHVDYEISNLGQLRELLS